MRTLIKLSFVLLGIVSLFSACKKDEVDLENSYMDIILGEYGLWIGENDLRYVANLSPGTLSGGETTIKFTSEADPEGFSITAKYWTTTVTFGRDVYNIQQIDRSIKVGAATNADENFLKVNPKGDKVTIDIGDGAFTETVTFEGKYDPLLVMSTGISGDGYLSGSIYYYNETGERPEIKMYSNTQMIPVTNAPNADLWDNGYREANVEVNDAFGVTYYSIILVTDPEKAPGYPYDVEVNPESDVIFVEIGDKKYSVAFEGEKLYKAIMTPAK